MRRTGFAHGLWHVLVPQVHGEAGALFEFAQGLWHASVPQEHGDAGVAALFVALFSHTAFDK